MWLNEAKCGDLNMSKINIDTFFESKQWKKLYISSITLWTIIAIPMVFTSARY